MESSQREILRMNDQKEIGIGNYVIIPNDVNEICIRFDGCGQLWCTLDEVTDLCNVLDYAIVELVKRKIAQKDYD
jgi:hypothetical protein